MFDIALTYAQRDSLISLQHTDSLQQRTQRRLTSGREVNDVTDDVFRYFSAKSLSDSAEELQEYKHSIDQGISVIKDNLAVMTALVDYFKTIKSILIGLVDKPPEERGQYDAVITKVLSQAHQLLADTRHGGVNLLSSTTNVLDLRFSNKHTLRIDSVDLFAVGNTTTLSPQGHVYYRRSNAQRFIDAEDVYSLSDSIKLRNFLIYDIPPVPHSGAREFLTLSDTSIDASVITSFANNASTIIKGIRQHETRLGIYVGILQNRLEHNVQFTSTLNKGVDKYTLSDINQEGAYLVALQARQLLGLNALGVSSRQHSAILSLF